MTLVTFPGAPEVTAGNPEQLRARSACAGLDPGLWYPTRGGTCTEARVICAGCPVFGMCLEFALETREKHGCWGGASERMRRRLRPVWAGRLHDYDEGCTDPGCRWCRTVDAHRAACETGGRVGAPSGPMQLNGDGANCGYRSTYTRGCRCGPCSLAISATGGRLRDAGLDIRAWWALWFGGNRARRLLVHAQRLAEFDTVPAQVAA